MTQDDIFARLIEAAHKAQAEREGEAYKAAQAELARIDTDTLALSQRREQVVSTLEAFDAAIEDTRGAIADHVAANYLDIDIQIGSSPDEPEDELFEPEAEITPIPNDEDEFATARRTGALS